MIKTEKQSKNWSFNFNEALASSNVNCVHSQWPYLDEPPINQSSHTDKFKPLSKGIIMRRPFKHGFQCCFLGLFKIALSVDYVSFGASQEAVAFIIFRFRRLLLASDRSRLRLI